MFAAVRGDQQQPGERPPAPGDVRLSVVIPAWNEESRIADSVRQFEGLPGAWERIVVDGGSGDRTLEWARKAGAEFVARAPRGRAAQMNHGAGLASGRFLLDPDGDEAHEFLVASPSGSLEKLHAAFLKKSYRTPMVW